MSTTSGRARAERLVNGALLALLLLVCAGFALLQTESPTPTPSTLRRVAAVLAVALYVTGCAVLLARARRRDAGAATAAPAHATSLPVVYASQTGQAEAFAQRTAASLRAAGVPGHVLAIDALDRAAFAAATRLLFVVSTTGEGDAPDMAAGFERGLLGTPLDLRALRYGLLALGDRDYAQYCGFGRRLDHWLRDCGATPWFDAVEVDNGDAGALRRWLHDLRQISGASELPDWEAPRYESWRLARRVCLNPGTQGEPAFHLELAPGGAEGLAWEAGDIAEIGPRHPPGTVTAWLARHGFDGGVSVERDGRRDTLAGWLARSHFPERVEARDPAAFVAALAPLPHREYSIASLPEDGAVHLLVRQRSRDDGTLGLGSGWLTAHAAPGAQIDLRLRRNRGFHLPGDDRPLLLVGNGTGIAGLRALLKARIARARHRNWLVFGERQAAVDHFYGDELERWHARGAIERLDLVFSRDGGPHRYVQHRLAAQADAVRDWCARGASIHVCGSLEGMAGAVDAVLRDILGREAFDALRDAGRYRRDVY